MSWGVIVNTIFAGAASFALFLSNAYSWIGDEPRWPFRAAAWVLLLGTLLGVFRTVTRKDRADPDWEAAAKGRMILVHDKMDYGWEGILFGPWLKAAALVFGTALYWADRSGYGWFFLGIVVLSMGLNAFGGGTREAVVAARYGPTALFLDRPSYVLGGDFSATVWRSSRGARVDRYEAELRCIDTLTRLVSSKDPFTKGYRTVKKTRDVVVWTGRADVTATAGATQIDVRIQLPREVPPSSDTGKRVRYWELRVWGEGWVLRFEARFVLPVLPVDASREPLL